MQSEKSIYYWQPVMATVIRHEIIRQEVQEVQEVQCTIHVETDLNFPGILPYQLLFDDPTPFKASLLPKVGSTIQAVVYNFESEILHLNASPSCLLPRHIRTYKGLYKFGENPPMGTKVWGTVKMLAQFGIFVTLDCSDFIGLIDIGFAAIYEGERLPSKKEDWPQPGDRIHCVINYFTGSNKQIGLGWLPE